MEECKVRARYAGLTFDDETLEYIVTNKDLIELSPKVMIPTLYDYWVHDVEVLKGHGRYKLYPSNPYETVINSRPAISFYNDNNPDWLNIMIFYHVLAHIDFFQNNILFENTWDDDFVGRALADKRMIANLRSEHGRWVDYVIEFSRGIDNLVGYFDALFDHSFTAERELPEKLDFYFSDFLQNSDRFDAQDIFEEIERFNELQAENPEHAESLFLSDVQAKYPEFQATLEKADRERQEKHSDNVMAFIIENSRFLKKNENSWMKTVMNIVQNTALNFEPQIRTKITNEGWASFWHDRLFRMDDRIKGHEVAYSKTHAGVTSVSRVGLNPYAIGMRLFEYVEKLANKGKLNFQFQKIRGIEERKEFDAKTVKGHDAIFSLRKNFSDFVLINSFVDQDFVDEHELFVVGIRRNQQRNTREFYVKSRNSEDYRQMLIDSLYHPPKILIDSEKTNDSNLYLVHSFEKKPLFTDYVSDTMLGIEYLFGGQVQLETTEVIRKKPESEDTEPDVELRRVLYTMKDRKISKENV
jgi:stage V sporulation protein R